MTALTESPVPLMLRLALPVPESVDSETRITAGAMTKYKTFNGEEINGQKVWHYDFHDDDV